MVSADAAPPSVGPDCTEDALAIAALLAVDGAALGGVILRGVPDMAREAWLQWLRALLTDSQPMRRIPSGIDDTALLGGLDLAATLRLGRPVTQPGVLAQADGGLLVLAMAERVPAAVAARLAQALDTGEVRLAREGVQSHGAARVGLIALDEGQSDEEQTPAALQDRLAFRLEVAELRGLPPLLQALAPSVLDHAALQQRLQQVQVDDDSLQALCATALALGIDSLRAPLLAVRAARGLAALDGRACLREEDVQTAARLVLAPRATRLPEPAPEDGPDREAAPPPSSDTSASDDATESAESSPQSVEPLAEQVLAAVQAVLPRGLLLMAAAGAAQRARGAAGRAGALRKTVHRGRPIGARRGEPRGGARLDVLQTLRAAAPWQGLRQREAEHLSSSTHRPVAAAPRIRVRRDDFHITRYQQKSTTTAIFAVDASGSSALHRLAEAKGAVELMLAECYVRRDRVAVMAFRGSAVDLLLPPTRSLARAKRSLAELPGGGGTPLAGALDAAGALALQVRRAGDTPLLVVLTDGRANIARDGSPGRQRAAEDAAASARLLHGLGVRTIWIDTSAQPQPAAQALALQAGAHYLPLPHANARELWSAVRQVAAEPMR